MPKKEYPYQNLSLKDIKGEQWEDIPGLDGYYLVSNYGRIKSLPRYIEVFIPKQQRSICYWTKERKLKVKIHKKWNSVIDKPYYECTVALKYEGSSRTFIVHRLVYNAFVMPINFKEDGLMIMHKDGDGLNNHYKNLVAGYRSDVTQKSYNKKRHVSPFALKSPGEKKEISHRAGISRQKPVIQLSVRGKKIKVFPSIKKASQRLGIPDSNIVRVLKGEGITAGGFQWQYYDGIKQ